MDEEQQEPQQLVDPPYFKFTLSGTGPNGEPAYDLETNMGPHWKGALCEIAAQVRRDWFGT